MGAPYPVSDTGATGALVSGFGSGRSVTKPKPNYGRECHFAFKQGCHRPIRIPSRHISHDLCYLAYVTSNHISAQPARYFSPTNFHVGADAYHWGALRTLSHTPPTTHHTAFASQMHRSYNPLCIALASPLHPLIAKHSTEHHAQCHTYTINDGK